VRFDAVDVYSCEAATRKAADQLGELALLLVTVGAAGFGPALDTPAALSDELFTVNVLAPMTLVRAAAHTSSPAGPSAYSRRWLSDLPTAGMADYSAAKTALATWLRVLRRENRRRFRVLRPPTWTPGSTSVHSVARRRGPPRRCRPRPWSKPSSRPSRQARPRWWPTGKRDCYCAEPTTRGARVAA
jgi:NADP-dependent 3-hydroxy acid dehydrogenase YdfG